MLTPAAEIRSGAGAAGPAPAHVTVRGLCKDFGNATIYRDFDLDIPRGKLVSVFGPNGCGKSTLINMIAGLIPADAGEILFDGKPLSQIKFGYVFQNYREALFPWLRSLENIEYPLKLMGMPKAERRARVERLVAHLGVKIDLTKYPYLLSGGQQQLVSIMRALVRCRSATGSSSSCCTIGSSAIAFSSCKRSRARWTSRAPRKVSRLGRVSFSDGWALRISLSSRTLCQAPARTFSSRAKVAPAGPVSAAAVVFASRTRSARVV